MGKPIQVTPRYLIIFNKDLVKVSSELKENPRFWEGCQLELHAP